MSSLLTTLVIVFASILSVHQCSKILVVYPFAAHSHFSLGFSLAKGLADHGHQVTFINSYPQQKPIKNLQDVSVADTLLPFMDELRKDMFAINNNGILASIQNYYNMLQSINNLTLEHVAVQKLLSDKESFDLVVVEFFGSEALFGLAAHFGAPLVIVSPFSSIMGNYLVANPSPPSYVPNIMGDFTSHMSFWQRLQNFMITQVNSIINYTMNLPVQRKLFNKHFPELDFDEVLYNVSLFLTNSHPSVTDPVPLQKNIIEIGGFHVKTPQRLPDDLQKFLDDAKEGVVLFSMGSNLKSKDLKPEVREGILKAFSKIKQKVLWKFETDLNEKPDNVRIMKWLPQNDILAHPNIKAFISHGGLLSIIETIYHGVPVIGIPVFGDQKSNIAGAVTKGFGITIPLVEVSEEKLSIALNEILNNPKYAENAKKRSKIMHDQPMKPLESAIFWIEHVIRHKGAPYLRSSGVDLMWFQRDMVDIVAFIVGILFSIVILLKLILKTIKNLLVNKEKVKVVKKTKKQN